MKKKLKVIIFTDPCLDMEPEDELEIIKDTLEDMLGKSYKIDAERVYPQEQLKDKLWDIFICDYGGMSIYGARDTAVSYGGLLHMLAEMHPSRLIIIWTQYTGYCYHDWVDNHKPNERNEDIPNILIIERTKDEDKILVKETVDQYFNIN